MEQDGIQNITCNVCGGNDFIKEGGFYYCSECQTQTQEIREQEYDQLDTTIQPFHQSKITIKKQKTDQQFKITSWEGYNYILAGLVNELIELGAKSELKEVTYQLWISYLIKLEILTKKGYRRPKLGIRYKTKDAELVYQHQKRKRKRTRSQSTTTSVNTDVDSKSFFKERTKRKKAMVNLEYESFTANTSSDTSLLNQTLSTLGSSDNESLESEKFIQFNKFSRKEFLKHMSHKHLRKHVKDYEGKLKCHKRKTFLTSSYQKSSYVIRRDKIYSILYLGLLLTESEIQLSDLLRYCREGHVSFLSYNHFFPEAYTEKQIDATVYQTGYKGIPIHKNIRETSYKIYGMLNLDPCDFYPDVNKLCEKYCMELNLPDEIKYMASNLIRQMRPEFKMKETKEGYIPNYEGRIMSFIILVLKLLFGLDGVTEYKFSDFARNINSKLDCTNKMFDFSEWIKFIEYRKIVLKSQHFPTCCLLDGNCSSNSNLFANFLFKQRLNTENERTNLSEQVIQKLLTDLDDLQDHNIGSFLEFPPTLTPFRSYTKKILKYNISMYNNELKKDVLKDTTNSSVDFLLYPSKYLNELNGKKYVIIENGANSNKNFMKMISKDTDKTVELTNEFEESFKELKIDELAIDKLKDKLLQSKLLQDNHNNKISLTHPEIKVELVLSSNKPNNVMRDSKGRFCKKNTPNKMKNPVGHKKRGKWFISSWIPNPILEQNKYNPVYTLTKGRDIQDIVDSDLEQANKKREMLNQMDGYHVHYEPHKEYWINAAKLDHRHFDKFMWMDLKNSLPFTFLWILNECSRIIEQDPRDLFEEFVTVELYFIYVFLKKSTTFTKSGHDNSDAIIKLVNSIKEEW